MHGRDELPPSDEATLAGEPPEPPGVGSAASDQATFASEQSTPARPRAQPRLARGDEVGRYMILERVGAGGMGVVHAAWDPKLDRKVALKLLHSDKQAHGQRLEREAQAMARLTHPNVIAVHDVGEVDGRVFVAMEFVEGVTLAEWAKLARQRSEAPAPSDGPERSWEEILEVLLAAGRGLAAAHAQGLVHRDFKPDNVMIGADGRVRVMDFGLVRAAGMPDAINVINVINESSGELAPTTEDEGTNTNPPARMPLDELPHMHTSFDSRSAFESQLTIAGSLLGTPAYMAPEQLRGEEADARADQFAYCVVLWQCLYGQRPFEGDTPLAVLFAISNGKFREVGPGRAVPSRIRRALERGLAADPKQRWPDMPSLLHALADDPRARRRPRVLGAASLALAAAAATAAIILQPAAPPSPCAHAGEVMQQTWSDTRERELAAAFERSELVYADETWARVAAQLDQWSTSWIAARKDTCEATELRHEQSAELLDLRMACLDQRLRRFNALVEVLAEADDTVIEKAVEAVEALPTLEVCSDRSWLTAAVRPPEDPELAGAVEQLREQLARVDALTDGGKASDALALAKQAEARARELGWQPLLAEASMSLGRVHQELGEFAESRAALQAGFFAARRGGHDEITVQSAYLLTYTLVVGLAEFEASSMWLEHARAEAERIGRRDLIAEVHAAIGIHHYLQGEVEPAADAFARALELHAGSRSTELATAHINYGTVLVRLDPKHEQQAFAELERGLEMLVERVGEQHPSVAIALSNYATVHGSLGHTREAIALLERALKINEQALGDAHPMTALIQLNLTTNLIDLGGREHLERAVALAQSSLETHRQVFGEQHVRVAESERALGRALLHLERPQEAAAKFDAASAIFRASFGDGHVEELETERLRARCDIALGKREQAITRLEAILAHESGKQTIALAQLTLAELLVEHDRPRARQLLDAAAPHLELHEPEAKARITKLRASLGD